MLTADIISVRVALLNEEGDLLTVLRPNDADGHRNQEEFPGGKRDWLPEQQRFETPEEAAVREAGEETGLEVTIMGDPVELANYIIPDGKHRGKSYLSLGFLGRITGGQLGTGSEQLPTAWRKRADLLSSPRYTPVTQQAAKLLCAQLATM